MFYVKKQQLCEWHASELNCELSLWIISTELAA